MTELFADILPRPWRFVPFNFVTAIAGNKAIRRTDLGILMKLLDPFVRLHFVAAEQGPLVVAPKVAADPLVHLDRTQRTPPLKAVAGFIGVDLLTKTVGQR